MPAAVELRYGGITMREKLLLYRVRWIIALFMFLLVLSGLTAFPLISGITVLNSMAGDGTAMEQVFPAMAHWISYVCSGLNEIHTKHAFMFYGTDWLAFGHIVIAVFFIGALRDPVRNVWVIESGMIACALVIPLALICGPIRGIPFFWQLIDCSFGAIGILPLLLCRRYIKEVETLRWVLNP